MYSKVIVEFSSLVGMMQAEKIAEESRYTFETQSPLSRICESSDALGPLVLKDKIALKTLRLSGQVYYSRFRPGDSVEIRIKRPGSDRSDKLSDGWKVESVSYPSVGQVEVIISGTKLIEINHFDELFLFKASSALFNNLLIRKMNQLGSSEESSVLGSGVFNLAIQNSKFRKLYDHLNATQKNAVEYLINNNLSGAIQGPPGTGKTQLLEAIISLAIHSQMKICVTSFTNAAVDNLLGRVVGSHFEYDWYRVGDVNKVKKEFYKKCAEDFNFVSPTYKQEVCEANLIGSTLHKIAYNKKAPIVDLLVIDEAGQVPIYFWPFIKRIARRIVLVGDQYQLPPVLATDHSQLPFDNVFSLLIDNDSPMLETQYRMRKEIQGWSSEKFYKGKLMPHASVASRDHFRDYPAFIGDGFVVPKQFDSNISGKSSKAEADFIVDKIERLSNHNVDLSDIGIICPYRAQAGLVNSTLQNRIGVELASKVLIDTVERFQGQEKEAIFLSLGSSGSNQDELRFLSDPKRLNVSITRAKSRFFCLYDTKLLERSHHSSSHDLNEFLRWTTFNKIKIRRAA